MNVEQRALRFQCHGDWLYGIASIPQQARARGVVVVVGGPQYRAGSHRQFALLAQALAERGHPVLRFDYRGMGDSEGEPRQFDEVGDDLRAAVDHFMAAVPGMTEVVLWGLCDGASAAAFYAARDERIAGVVMLNPWVRTDEGKAMATLKHYYLQRLRDPALWKKLVGGAFDFRAAFGSLAQVLKTVAGKRAAEPAAAAPAPAALPLRERMLAGIEAFSGRLLLVISAADLTAQEFLDMERASPAWRKVLNGPRVQRFVMQDADHTFSRREWRNRVADRTAGWLESW
ncbi:MAG: hydrolase 1, exosortase A system-associated [Telluria sp.]